MHSFKKYDWLSRDSLRRINKKCLTMASSRDWNLKTKVARKFLFMDVIILF